MKFMYDHHHLMMIRQLISDVQNDKISLNHRTIPEFTWNRPIHNVSFKTSMNEQENINYLTANQKNTGNRRNESADEQN